MNSCTASITFITDLVIGDRRRNSGIVGLSMNFRQVHAITASSVRFTWRGSAAKIDGNQKKGLNSGFF